MKRTSRSGCEDSHPARVRSRGTDALLHVRRCLGWRLVFFLAAMLLVLMGGRGWLSMGLQREQMEEQLEGRAVDIGEAVLSSTKAAMLANDWARLEEDLENIAGMDRVVAVRIIDTNGEVRVSTNPADVGSIYREDGFACEPCHRSDSDGTPMTVRGGLHLYGRDPDAHLLGLAAPIRNEASCSEAACHAHDPDQAVLGILDVELSTASIQLALAAQRNRMFTLDLIALLVICSAVGVLAWRLVHRPLHEVVSGTRRIGSGDLDHRLPEDGFGELRDLSIAFNQMAVQVQSARADLQGWNQDLEERVQEKSRELEQARDHMVFTEKMASLGRLASVVAHEINNPLAGILITVKVLRRRIERVCEDEEQRKETDSSLEMVQRETARCGDIVRNLLFFSRQREPSLAVEDLAQVVRRALDLVDHQAELNNVSVHFDDGNGIAQVACDANQIQQACLVAVLNAIDAMPDGGELRVIVRDGRDQSACIEIIDTGCGIPEDLQLKVFEPFFSTKPEGEGTGLGLSVLYGIVQRHGGRVELESEPGQGTTVRIRLPRAPDPATFSHPEAMT
ncbi:hypothetical protein DRQ53_10875 [bacterium]|nr:MAG: hypothetical protein DRQ53_10875 [bacterium]